MEEGREKKGRHLKVLTQRKNACLTCEVLASIPLVQKTKANPTPLASQSSLPV